LKNDFWVVLTVHRVGNFIGCTVTEFVTLTTRVVHVYV